MGTNYYLISNECDHCERRDILHIGKSSAGWNFVFRAYDEINCIEDWMNLLENKSNKIQDEYDNPVENVDFLSICLRKEMRTVENEDRFFKDSKGFSFCSGEFS